MERLSQIYVGFIVRRIFGDSLTRVGREHLTHKTRTNMVCARRRQGLVVRPCVPRRLASYLRAVASRDELIRSMSKVRLDQLQLKPDTKAQFADWFQFTPSPQIKRVIFIGTPHQGSDIAKGIVTQLASRIIRQPDELEDVFDELIENNERVLTTNLKRIPNSIDLLRPDDALRQAIFKLPVDPNVSLHTLIGVGHGGKWGRERSDGVVPYHSAQHPGVKSEVTVDAGHSLHNHPEATAEVVRILRLHAAKTSVSNANPVAALFDSFKP